MSTNNKRHQLADAMRRLNPRAMETVDKKQWNLVDAIYDTARLCFLERRAEDADTEMVRECLKHLHDVGELPR